ncbi:sulfatase-like hydrolase/transferase [Streptomyces sp. NBC_00029]|uniref:hypothetical protein n=1 Tax=Streptomyces sp. NBC_00029 TaxID=2903613 RepID=UPI00325683C1
MTERPNILLIVTDEERASLPRPPGFSLPARERIAARGTTFERYYTALAQCSSARSVIYTGQHLPLTEIYDNDNMPYIRPLNPELGRLRHRSGVSAAAVTHGEMGAGITPEDPQRGGVVRLPFAGLPRPVR